MTRPIIFALPCCDNQVSALAAELDAAIGDAEVRRFPDFETYLRVLSDVRGREVVLLGSLDRPDAKILPLIFLTRALKQEGAKRVGLVAPYLAYMRQDRQFKSGEGLTSVYFASLLSRELDWLVTVDPHLHRIHDLREIYSIPTRVVHAAPAVAAWVAAHVKQPILIGPDEESEQWIGEIAKLAKAPFTVLTKVRRGDRDVQVSIPQPQLLQDRTPVLVDDIVSTAGTMIATVKHLQALKAAAPICLAVHAIFAGNAASDLTAAGAAKIVTVNTVVHPSNGIDLTAALAAAAGELLATAPLVRG